MRLKEIENVWKAFSEAGGYADQRGMEIADERSTVRLVVQGVQPCWCAWLGTFPLAVLAGWCKDKQ